VDNINMGVHADGEMNFVTSKRKRGRSELRSESSEGARNVLSREMRLDSGVPKVALEDKTRTNAALLHNYVLKLDIIQQLSSSFFFLSSLPFFPPLFC
jgi:hypothetical protein